MCELPHREARLHEVTERRTADPGLPVGQDLREEDPDTAALAHRPQGAAAALEPFEGQVRLAGNYPGIGAGRLDHSITGYADRGDDVAVPEPRHEPHALARLALEHVHLGHL